MTQLSTSAQQFMEELLQTEDLSTLINCENNDKFDPGSPAHGAVYEQVSRFKQAAKSAVDNNYMTDKQYLMFACRFVRSMRQLVRLQNNSEAPGLDAHVRAGQATLLFIHQSGKWFTKLNKSNDILCTGAYLAACSRKTNCWTFLLYTEDGDIHKD